MLDIVFNPKAAKGRAERALKKVEKKLTDANIAYRVHKTHYQRHATEVTKELIAAGAQTVIAMGGDGTINEVLNGFSDFENVNMGIIPCGSGNDFAGCIKLPLKPEEALDIILNGEAKPTDYMDCSGVRGINIIGTGIDVDVLKRYKKGKIFRGKVQYMLSLIVSLFKFKDYRLSVSYNGKTEDRKALVACACNGRMLGGGIKICPIAVPDDGFMDYVVAFDVKKRKIPGAFIKLMKGKILEEPIAYTEKTTRLLVESPDSLTVNVDGELYDDLPFDVRLISGELKLYRP